MQRLALMPCCGSPTVSVDINGDHRKALSVTREKLYNHRKGLSDEAREAILDVAVMYSRVRPTAQSAMATLIMGWNPTNRLWYRCIDWY